MRVLFGIVLGVALTVGAAFIADTWATGGATSAPQHRSMVNWDVVGNNMRVVQQHAREVWAKISQKTSG